MWGNNAPPRAVDSLIKSQVLRHAKPPFALLVIGVQETPKTI